MFQCRSSKRSAAGLPLWAACGPWGPHFKFAALLFLLPYLFSNIFHRTVSDADCQAGQRRKHDTPVYSYGGRSHSSYSRLLNHAVTAACVSVFHTAESYIHIYHV